MFHLFGGGTEARRLPGRFQVPWTQIVLIAVVLATATGVGFGVKYLLSSRTNTAPAVPIQQPVAQPVQQAPVVVAPVAPKIVDYQVVWTEVQGFDPFTIPVEEGFYNGTFPVTGSWSPNDPNDIPEGDTYAWKVLPHLKEVGRGTIVATTRDQVNKDVVLVSIRPAARYQPYLLLSVDGEKSWCMLNMLPVYWGGYQHGIVNDPRVVARGEEIHLYGQDARPGYHWWETVVKKSELPCS